MMLFLIRVAKNIKEGLLVRNIHIGLDCEPSKVFFSIKNNLPYRVSDIRILFLIYDASGIVIDYDENTYFPSFKNNAADLKLSPNAGIKPFLAKIIDQCDDVSPEINWRKGYKVNARILDFKIIDE